MSAEEKVEIIHELDETKIEAFAGWIVGVINDAMLALMMSTGHQTELLDAMADLPPSTSEEIASAANLDERYVREWLGAMVVGGVGLGTVWGEHRARQMLADAGFGEVEVEQVESDILNNYYLARKC